jgi:hypothetical protein
MSNIIELREDNQFFEEYDIIESRILGINGLPIYVRRITKEVKEENEPRRIGFV